MEKVPHAYKVDEDLKTLRHASGNGKPVIDYDLSRNYASTWKAMEALVKTGRVRSIGMCRRPTPEIVTDDSNQ